MSVPGNRVTLGPWQGRFIEPIKSIAIVTDPLIEDVIGWEAAEIIYANWDTEQWGNLIDFGGGEYGIDVGMILAVSLEDLTKMPGMNEVSAKHILQACKDAYEKEPFH